VSSDTPWQDPRSQRASGKGRWTVLGATFGFAPWISTSGLAMLDKLNPPTWLIVISLASPMVGALLGLFSYVIVVRTECQSMISRVQAEASADAIRQSLRQAPQLKPGYVLEVITTRTPNGLQAIIRYGKEHAGETTTSSRHVVGHKQPLSGNRGGTTLERSSGPPPVSHTERPA
jgi:hypothetical protein